MRRRLELHLDKDLGRRPFAGVVDEVANDLLEILALAAKFGVWIGLQLNGDTAVAVDLFHGPPQRLDRGCDLGDGADDGDAGCDARPLQMMRHLVAHHVGLFQHLGRKWIGGVCGSLVEDHRQRRLDGVGEIADMGARALDDFAVGVDQRIGLARQRRNFNGKLARRGAATAARCRS